MALRRSTWNRRRDVSLLALNFLRGVRPKNMLEVLKRLLRLGAHGWFLEPLETKPVSCLAPLGRGRRLQAELSFFRETPFEQNDLVFRRRDRFTKSSRVCFRDAPARTQKRLCDSFRQGCVKPGLRRREGPSLRRGHSKDIEAYELLRHRSHRAAPSRRRLRRSAHSDGGDSTERRHRRRALGLSGPCRQFRDLQEIPGRASTGTPRPP
jgi:hypothetical protein